MGENSAGKDHNRDRERDDRDVRRARLGAALRENLKRRKAQARRRDAAASSSPDSADAGAAREE